MRHAVLALAAAFAGCGGATIGDPPQTNGGGADAMPVVAAPDAAPAAPPDAAPCVAGDAQIRDPVSGHCLAFFSEQVTWATARNACNAIGGDLAVPTSDQENDLLWPLSVDPVNAPDAWLDGTDAAHEGTWVWADGEPWSYEHFRTGEPNNGGTSGTPENCLVMETDNQGTWDDRACARLYPFYCELP